MYDGPAPEANRRGVRRARNFDSLYNPSSHAVEEAAQPLPKAQRP
jgi:hypothetical protein